MGRRRRGYGPYVGRVMEQDARRIVGLRRQLRRAEARAEGRRRTALRRLGVPITDDGQVVRPGMDLWVAEVVGLRNPVAVAWRGVLVGSGMRMKQVAGTYRTFEVDYPLVLFDVEREIRRRVDSERTPIFADVAEASDYIQHTWYPEALRRPRRPSPTEGHEA